jgi:hypothetical protein
MKLKIIQAKLIILLNLLFLISESEAQDFIWNAGLNTFFDNREYYNEYAEPQTIFGIRPFASVGISIFENYSISAGLDALYEFGSTLDQGSIDPIVYFRYQKEPVIFLMGAFHRKNLSDYPNVLQTDTIQYYRPTIEGIYLKLSKSWGFHNIWLDWTSRQTENNREVFSIGGSGGLKKSILFYKHDFIMTHFALPANSQPDDHIRDNGGFYARIGLHKTNAQVLDSLSFCTGYTMSYDRLRGIYDYDIRSGSMSEFYIQYKGFGLNSILYLGEGQVQMLGDPLYSASFYTRNDFFWKIFRKNNIEGKVEFSLHIIENVIDVSQALTLYVNIGGKKTFKQSNN